MEKILEFITWITINFYPAAPTRKDIEEFNKQQPEKAPPTAVAIALLVGVPILFVGFIVLAFL